MVTNMKQGEWWVGVPSQWRTTRRVSWNVRQSYAWRWSSLARDSNCWTWRCCFCTGQWCSGWVWCCMLGAAGAAAEVTMPGRILKSWTGACLGPRFEMTPDYSDPGFWVPGNSRCSRTASASTFPSWGWRMSASTNLPRRPESRKTCFHEKKLININLLNW